MYCLLYFFGSGIYGLNRKELQFIGLFLSRLQVTFSYDQGVQRPATIYWWFQGVC